MIPDLDDFLKCCARWTGEHNGIRYELSWHGKSEYNEQGTWCWYIIVTEQQFYPEDWKRLRLERRDHQFATSWHRDWNYDAFPDVEPHGGWTFGEMTTYLGKDGKEYERAKVGCDYAHAWDRDGGYWHGKDDVERDVKRSIDLLCEMFPRRRPRCAYSGKYDDPEQFYTAINGALVHKSYEQQFRDKGDWPTWLPADAA